MIRTVYLAVGEDRAFGLLHAPSQLRRPTVGVVLCPPFGWDDVCSYRSRRAWAEALAQAGIPALRIDLPGTGDSAGSCRDPHRLEAWTNAVSDAIRWLRAETGCARVATIGIGVGGFVACHAVARGAQIDDLVLWGVPARGRTLVRELRAFASLQPDAATANPGPELEAGGFVITAETMAALERLDLTAAPPADGARRRVLLLERDGLPPDRRLREHFEEGGASVEIAPGDGYGAMMDDPRLARSPREVIARTVAWLSDSPSRPDAFSPEPFAIPASRGQLELIDGTGACVIETPLSLELSSGRVFGVLAEPVDRRADVCCVLLNAGAIRRIGPNRMWVELARRWAARGVPTLRIDLRGLGDSDGDEQRYANVHELYVPELTEQALATLDALCERGLPPRFVLGGLCCGAFWAFRAAVADPRVTGALMINLWGFQWSPALVAERDARRAAQLLHRRESAEWASPTTLREVGLRTSARRAARLAVHISQGRPARRRRVRELELELDELRARDVELLLAFSRSEPLRDDLARDGLLAGGGRWPNLACDAIPSGDHTFRAIGPQRHVHARLDRALEDVLTRERVHP